MKLKIIDIQLDNNSSTTINKQCNSSKRITATNVYVKDYIKKRNLILELLAVEVELLLVWNNPGGRQELSVSGESSIIEWRSKSVTDR